VHIEALDRDRKMIASNAHSIDTKIRMTRASLHTLDLELREAERALMNVTAAIGTEREQIAKIVAEILSLERQIERAREAMAEMHELQADIDKWLVEAQSSVEPATSSSDLSKRKAAFLDVLRKYLIELQHSEVNSRSVESLSLDKSYVPYLNYRRLRSAGSASDQARLTMAYALALAAAGTWQSGFHPGIVLLDEPLQQNADQDHRRRFIQFLGKDLARNASFQTIIFTSLRSDEVTQLRKQGVSVQTLEGEKWLRLLPVAEHSTEN
jgi:DNA repair exonuclease SbcCD ATPase subunit